MLNKIKSLFKPRNSVVELWQSAKDKKWYYHLKAGNGKVQAPSQGYTTKSNSLRSARNLFPDLEVIEVSDPNV